MRKISTFILFLLLGIYTQAQITIERNDFTFDIFSPVQSWGLDDTNASIPASGEDMVWDYSSSDVLNNYFVEYNEVSVPEFPDANLYYSLSRQVLGGLALQNNEIYGNINESGYSIVGEKNKAVDLSLQSLTGGENDSLKILETIQTYSEPEYVIKFPLNYGDSWASENILNLDFLTTIAAFGLQNTPTGQDFQTNQVDSVVGYGTLILPHPEVEGGISMEALLVKRVEVITNSYFLGGEPAPQVMLDALGLEQGEMFTYSSYRFYSKGLPRSAAEFVVNSDGSIAFITFSDDIKALSTSTSNIATELIPVKAFPNPARENFQLIFDKSDPLDWSVEMYNTIGQTVHQQVITGATGMTHLNVFLPTLNPGQYMYVLRNRLGMVMASGSVILQ